jgi:Protein of unknown function (DUF2812).
MRTNPPLRFLFSPDHDKLEIWVNEKSSQGMQLVRIGWWGYYFEKDETNKYTYKIDFLKAPRKNIETQNYLRFLNETGVDIIPAKGMWNRWVWLRGKPEGECFDLYSDIESKINRYERFGKMIGIATILMAILTLVGWGLVALLVEETGGVPIPNLFCVFLTVMYLFGYVRTKIKIRKLKEERSIRE